MTSNNGLSLTNTRDVKANNIYLNSNSDIINILDLFSFKNDTSNITDSTYTKAEVDNALLLNQTKITDVSDTEIGYLNGVTQPIQQQFNARQKKIIFSLPETNTTASWVKIGNLSTTQGGYVTRMIINSSDS